MKKFFTLIISGLLVSGIAVAQEKAPVKEKGTPSTTHQMKCMTDSSCTGAAKDSCCKADAREKKDDCCKEMSGTTHKHAKGEKCEKCEMKAKQVKADEVKKAPGKK